MTIPTFTSDHYDALAEICNLAMGQAGAALAGLLDVFVCLTSPSVKILEASELLGHLQTRDDPGREVTAVRQSFYGKVTGEVIALHLAGQPREIHDLLGYAEEPDDQQEREILFDVSNLVNGAVVNGIWRPLGVEVGFSPPSLLAERTALRDLGLARSPAWNHVLLCEVSFQLENRAFAISELVFLPDDSFAFIRDALDRFLERIG